MIFVLTLKFVALRAVDAKLIVPSDVVLKVLAADITTVELLYEIVESVVGQIDAKKGRYPEAFEHARELLTKKLGVFVSAVEGLHRITACNMVICARSHFEIVLSKNLNIFWKFAVDIADSPLNEASLRYLSQSISDSCESGAVRSFADEISDFIL